MRGRLTVGGRPTRAKNRRNPIFRGIGRSHYRVRESRRLPAVIRNRDLRGIESPTGDIESISRDFDAAREMNSENSLQRIMSRGARRADYICVSPRTTEPGNMRPNARHGISAVREQCGRSAGASKWPRRNLNLPLAAGPRVRHIRVDGAVAEWLKAAVC
jgi:hypothetical protein